MPVRPGKAFIGLSVHGQRRGNVEQHQAPDLVGMINGHAMSHPCTAVMGEHIKMIEPQVLHDPDLVQRHGAFGVIAVVCQALGFRGVPVAPEITHDHRVSLTQGGCDPMPDGVGLGVAVQQQKRWATARHQGVDVDIAQV